MVERHKTDTQTLIKALRILAVDIQSEDGIANAAIADAADRLEELQARLTPTEWGVDGDMYSAKSLEETAQCHDFPDCGILEINGWALTHKKYAIGDFDLLDRSGTYANVFQFFDTREAAVKAMEELKDGN